MADVNALTVNSCLSLNKAHQNVSKELDALKVNTTMASTNANNVQALSIVMIAGCR